MKVAVPAGTTLPQPITEKLGAALAKADAWADAAQTKWATNIQGKFSFTYTISAPRDVLTPLERAQSLSFITRYDHLPEIDEIRIQPSDGRFHLGSLYELRYALTEYRPIIMNQADSSYFQNVGATLRQKLLNEDASVDLRIQAIDESGRDISKEFAAMLKERSKGIAEVIRLADFDYLYNGILQHSDPRFTTRFWKEYHEGTLNYVYITHAATLGFIKESLHWHYVLLNALTFPKLGPL